MQAKVSTARLDAMTTGPGAAQQKAQGTCRPAAYKAQQLKELQVVQELDETGSHSLASAEPLFCCLCSLSVHTKASCSPPRAADS